MANEIVGNSIDVLNDAYGAGMNIANFGEIRGITISGNTAKSSASSVFGAESSLTTPLRSFRQKSSIIRLKD